jgi:hypothetical protein
MHNLIFGGMLRRIKQAAESYERDRAQFLDFSS